MKTIEQQLHNNCKHFKGLHHGTCQAGVSFDDVKDVMRAPFGWPCFRSGSMASNAKPCAKRQFRTPEETAKEAAEIQAEIERCEQILKESGNQAT
jgi:hypothetical protein